MDTKRQRSQRALLSVVGLLLVAAVGFVAAVVGAITCHEEVESSQQAPHLCASAGTTTGLLLAPVTGIVLVVLLALSRLRTRTMVCAIAAIAVAEGALLLMWALVNHGTIHY